jgi:hypothetical protein
LSGLSQPSQRICFYVLLASSFVTFAAAQKPPAPTPTSKAQPRPQPPHRAGRVTSAHLTAMSVPRRAACPVKLHFVGTITTNGPSEVKYTWESFDGGAWPTGTLRFGGPATQKVTQEWQLGAAGQTVHGWLQLKVTSPNAVVSNRAPFNVVCAGGGGSRRK